VSSQPDSTHDDAATFDLVVRSIRLALDEPNADVQEGDELGDLGLDSLGRLSLVVAVEESFGITLPEELVTPSMTVSKFQLLISSGSSPSPTGDFPKWPYRRDVRWIGDALRDHVFARVVRHWVTLDVEGLENLSSVTSPSLFIFNHTDDFDGPVIYEALPRAIRRHMSVAVGADVMRDHKVLAFSSRLGWGAFGFSRESPFRPSLEYVGDMLKNGHHVLFAPEGRLSTDGELLDFKPGVGYFVSHLGVTVVPLKTKGLSGTVPLHANWPQKHSHVTVKFGEPMHFGATKNYAEVTASLRQAVDAL
jgi:1-acyl-sn-glycerol-3-phosphate acyltransferase/acyl carrier protein